MKKNKKTLIAAIPLFLIVILVFAGFGVWKKYRDTLMQNQEEQMLLTTRILSENMAMSAEEYEESLSFLAKTAENRPQDEAIRALKSFSLKQARPKRLCSTSKHRARQPRFQQ